MNCSRDNICYKKHTSEVVSFNLTHKSISDSHLIFNKFKCQLMILNAHRSVCCWGFDLYIYIWGAASILRVGLLVFSIDGRVHVQAGRG